MNREPIPPPATRGDALGRLKRERWYAADAGETAEVERIDRRIRELSAANSPAPPTRETAAATTPRAAAQATNRPMRGNRRAR